MTFPILDFIKLYLQSNAQILEVVYHQITLGWPGKRENIAPNLEVKKKKRKKKKIIIHYLLSNASSVNSPHYICLSCMRKHLAIVQCYF